MSYRELQLRSLIKKDYIPKTQYQQEVEELKKARAQDLIDTLQKDLGIDFLLDYSDIVKKLKGRSVEEVLEEENNKDKETNRIQNLLNDTVNLLGNEETKNLTDLTNLLQGQTLKELVQIKDLLNQKIKDQDLALINLAKQKIKNNKQAEQLINQLQTNWSKKEIEWETEKQNLISQQDQEREQWNQQLSHNKKEHQKTVKELKKQLADNSSVWELEKEVLGREKEGLLEQLKALNTDNDKLGNDKKILVKQLEDKEEELVKNREKTNSLEKQLTNALKSVSDLQSENKEIIKLNQEQLRKINILFDINAVDYETIDFNGLYNLLVRFKERVRLIFNPHP